MTPGERFKSWIDDRRKDWGEALGNFLLGVIAKGVKKSVGADAPTPDYVKTLLAQYEKRTGTSDDITVFIDFMKSMEDTPIGWFFGIIIMAVQTLGIILSGSEALGNEIKYAQNRVIRSQILDPISAITSWRRTGATDERELDDLRAAGFSEVRIKTLKFITDVIPGVQDLIRMGVREAFDDDFAKTWGMDEEFSKMPVEWAKKQGYSEEWSKYSWRAHWELPSVELGYELLHRGIITEKELGELMTALDIMPGWRKHLIKLSWNIPTRVDVRRFWDMRTIDEARLREIYQGLGYHAQDLEDYVLWTKIFVDFPDLLARYKNGWIALDQVKRELVAMGMKPERADTLIEEKVKKSGQARTVTEKDLTATDIYKGVKQERITRAEAEELLIDIGYDSAEAAYKLAVNVPEDEEDKAKEERQLTKADILSGLKEAIITRDEARQKLLGIRYSVANAELLLKIFDAQVTPPKEVKLKEASKADIVLGVKKGLITQEEGYMMLLDIDFSPEASLFILSVATEESPFSPINYAEFKDLTQKYRLAAGMEGKPMTEEIKKLGAQVVRLSAEVDALQKSIKAEQAKLLDTTVLPEEATIRVKELQATLYKAQAELTRVKTDYNAKVAEWKHAVK